MKHNKIISAASAMAVFTSLLTGLMPSVSAAQQTSTLETSDFAFVSDLTDGKTVKAETSVPASLYTEVQGSVLAVRESGKPIALAKFDLSGVSDYYIKSAVISYDVSAGENTTGMAIGVIDPVTEDWTADTVAYSDINKSKKTIAFVNSSDLVLTEANATKNIEYDVTEYIRSYSETESGLITFYLATTSARDTTLETKPVINISYYDDTTLIPVSFAEKNGADATITVDGIDVTNGASLPAGEFTFTATAPGYEDYTGTLSTIDTESVNVEFEMTPRDPVNSVTVNYICGETIVYSEEIDANGYYIGETATIPYRQYVSNNGVLYNTPINNNQIYYGKAVTMTEDTVVDIYATEADLNGGTLAFMVDLDDSADSASNIARASNMSNYNNKVYTSDEILGAGKYKFMIRNRDYGRGSSVAVGDTIVFTQDSSNRNLWKDDVVEDVVINTPAAVKLVPGSAGTIDSFDTIIAIKTGDAEEIIPTPTQEPKETSANAAFVGQNRGTYANGVFTTDKNASNQYALALADLSSIPGITDTNVESVKVEFTSQIASNARFLVGAGDKSVRGTSAGSSNKNQYDSDGLILYFGTKDGTAYRVKDGTSNAAAFGKNVKATITLTKSSSGNTYSYSLADADDGSIYFNESNITTDVSNLTVIEAYSWQNNSTISLSDVSVTVKKSNATIYTVTTHYVDEEGNRIVADTQTGVLDGNGFIPTYEERIEDEANIYTYKSSSSIDAVTEDSEVTVVYTKTVKPSVNSIKIQYMYEDNVISEESVSAEGLYVGNEATIPFREFIEKDGSLYKTANNSETYYGEKITLAEDNVITKTLTQVDLGGGSLVFFVDLDDTSDDNAKVRASNMSAYSNKEYSSETVLERGIYTFIIRNQDRGRASSVAVGKTKIFTQDNTARNTWRDSTIENVEVTKAGAVNLVAGEVANTIDCYDVIIAIKTGDVEAETGLEADKSSAQAVYVNDSDKAVTVDLFAASYNEDGSLKSIKLKTVDVAAGETNDYITLDMPTDGVYSKVFFWNDTDQTPITSTVQIQ